MYESFFGFTEKPFKITPDSHLLFNATEHVAAIKTLEYGIREKRGFMMLTGEVGTGKTTTLRALMAKFGDSVHVSLIINPLLSTLDLIQTINKDFGNPCSASNLHEQIDHLNKFLLNLAHTGKSAVVIIDEAQNLSNDSLEMTRLLSNLETESQKLLQIILAGQPELKDKLAKKELRQLAQRIQIHSELSPLKSRDTEQYIRHRLSKSGINPHVSFEKNAMGEIHKKSGGVPRVINSLCDLTLLAAYSRDTRVITKAIVQEAAREIPFYVHHS